MVCGVYGGGGGGGGGRLLEWIDIQKTKNSTRIIRVHLIYNIFHGMIYFPDPVEDIRNPLTK
jgi:hypothetical protein